MSINSIVLFHLMVIFIFMIKLKDILFENKISELTIDECGCDCEMCQQGYHHSDHELEFHTHDDEEEMEEPKEGSETYLDDLVLMEKKKKKGDRCVRIARRKYHKWPSAYASGAVVKCRQGKIWKDLKESLEENEQELTEEEMIAEENLHQWFSHNKGNPKFKGSGGWVNCRTGGPCGRHKAGRGARKKYPACRPTMSQCKSGAVKRKKSSKRISWKDQRKK